MGALEESTGFRRQFDLPLVGRNVEYAQCSTSTEPAFSHFFEVPQAVDHISLRVFLGQVQEMDSAGSVSDIDDDITDLFETVGAFVHPHQF